MAQFGSHLDWLKFRKFLTWRWRKLKRSISQLPNQGYIQQLPKIIINLA
jgi:hypothetical protein